MNTIRFFIIATMVSLASTASLTALPLKDQIINEVAAVQAQPDGGIKQTLYLKNDCLVVTQDCMPALYQMVSNLAEKLSISVPWILIYTDHGCNVINNAIAYSWHYNFGTIVIGHNTIKQLSVAELEAIIAHELGHVAHNHSILSWPLLPLGGLIGRIPIVNKMHKKYLIAIHALLRYHEVEADLCATSIIDNPQMLSSALDKLHAMSSEVENFKKVCGENPLISFFSTYPSLEKRKKCIDFIAAEKLKEKEKVKVSA